jgi:hypothetical protein
MAFLPSQCRWLLMCDIDGVFHPNFPLKSRPPEEGKKWCYLPRFEAVLRAHSDVALVITSTWRKDTSLSRLRQHFSMDLRPRIIGATPILSEIGPGSRQSEVEAWLAAHPEWAHLPWIAVDDIADLYRPGECVVETQDGFREADQARLEAALADPQTYAAQHPVPDPTAPRGLWLPEGC